MLIRPLELQDKDKIHQMLCRSMTFNASEIQVAMELVDEVLRNPQNQDYQIYTAVDPPEGLAGFICYGPIPLTDYCYDLYWIAVDRDYSKKGVGGRLVEFMETTIFRENGKHIYVDTSSTPPYQPARIFYKKKGYYPVCTLKNFYRQGDHKIIFKKEI